MSSTEGVLPVISAMECDQIVCESLRGSGICINGEVEKFKVTEFSLRNIGEEAVGFLGGYLSLTAWVEINADEKPKVMFFFIKTLPFDNETKREIVEKLGAFDKELKLLRDLFPHIGGTEEKTQWRPKVLYHREDLIVFEDLTKRGYEILPGRVLFEADHVKISLDSIARLHANSLAYEILEMNGQSIDEIYGNILFTTITPDNTWYMAGLEANKYLASHHPQLQRFDGKLSNYSEMIKTIFHRLSNFKTFRSTLCHMDLWKSNIMMKFEPTEDGKSDYSLPLHALLVDFQFLRYCPPGLDVMVFIHTMTSRINRNEHLESYLLHYYKVFSKTLDGHGLVAENVISWDEFRSSCDYFKLCGATYASVIKPCIYLPDKYLSELDKIDQSLQYKIIHVNRNEFMIDFLKKDQLYADIVLDSSEEFLELLLECN